MLPDLETPALLVDHAILERNVHRMAEYTAAHGLALRPHVKTHKSPRVAALQVARGAAGLTCATPREAEVMGAASDDLLVAHPPFGPKARRLAALADGTRLTVALDSTESLDALAAAAREAGRTIGVYVELDVGMKRVGVPGLEEAIVLARRVAGQPRLEYRGIAFYPGQIREPVDRQDDALAELSRRLDHAITTLDAAGLRPEVVSGGSTPTAWAAHRIPGVTEVRPGTYVYNDRTTAAIGACAWEECALTVLATVVSTAVPGQAVIDAGTKALGREPVRGAEGEGFGALLDRPEVVVSRMSEEHGVLDLSATSWRPKVGDTVRVVPNHVCIVVHLFDEVHVLRDGDVERWPVAARGRA